MADRTEKQVSSNLSVLTVVVAGLAMAGCVPAFHQKSKHEGAHQNIPLRLQPAFRMRRASLPSKVVMVAISNARSTGLTT